MSENIFENIQKSKNDLKELVNKADSFGWWKEDDKKEKKNTAEQILKSIDSDILTIGVIGQMKCGKSTFLNSFVFGKEILPAAITPMTAALTIITYGQSEKIEAEFYNADEWAEQQQIANLDIKEYEGDSIQQSKIKAAQELVNQSKKSGIEINKYLGKKQTDELNNLIEYVGAEGKYVSITKSVKIEYPKEYLKGVEIVDTPGFNDPIVSREERTKDFLKKADAVLMMLYANQPFSHEDNVILFDNVKKCGVGKVLVAVNKYDLPLSNGEKEQEMTSYIKDELEKAIRESGDSTISTALGKDFTPICISAQMELLSQLPMSEIDKDEDKKFHLNKLYKTFGISSQAQLHEMSNFDKIAENLKKVILEDKAEILFRKPITRILITGELKQSQLEKELSQQNTTLSNCNKPDEQLEEENENLQKVIRKANKKIDSLGDDIDDILKSTVKKGERELEDILDSTTKKMNRRIDDWGVFQNSSRDKLERDLKSMQEQLVEHDIKYKLDEIEGNAKCKITSSLYDFASDIEELIVDRLDNIDTKEIVHALKKDLDFTAQKYSIESDDFKEGGVSRGTRNAILAFGGGLIGLGTAWDMISHESKQGKYKDKVDDFKKSFDPSSFLNHILCQKDIIIENTKHSAIDNCLKPLQDSVQEIIDKKEEREKMKKETQNKVNSLEIELNKIKQQLEDINNLEIIKRYKSRNPQ